MAKTSRTTADVEKMVSEFEKLEKTLGELGAFIGASKDTIPEVALRLMISSLNMNQEHYNDLRPKILRAIMPKNFDKMSAGDIRTMFDLLKPMHEK